MSKGDLVAEFVPAVSNIISLLERRDWVRFERALSPDIHWITAVEEHLYGPSQVVECLKGDGVPGPPAFHEVDDQGLLVLWVDKMG